MDGKDAVFKIITSSRQIGDINKEPVVQAIFLSVQLRFTPLITNSLVPISRRVIAANRINFLCNATSRRRKASDID